MLLKANRSRAAAVHRSAKRRNEVAKKQYPIAAIVACADSRVAPELVFNRGYGDLFVVRTAGNVVDDIGLGSLEYAVEHLGVKLILVLGHERCGAVDAALGGEAHGHIKALVDAIKPGIENVKDKPGDRLDNAVRANAVAIASNLRSSTPVLAGHSREGMLVIAAARYDMDTGAVEIIK
jgi:carbonic anhydrase